MPWHSLILEPFVDQRKAARPAEGTACKKTRLYGQRTCVLGRLPYSNLPSTLAFTLSGGFMPSKAGCVYQSLPDWAPETAMDPAPLLFH